MIKCFFILTLLVICFFSSSCSNKVNYNYVKVKESLSPGKTDNLKEDELAIEALIIKAAEFPLCA